MAASHSLDVLAGGVLVGGFDGTTLSDDLRQRITLGHLAGVTLFKRNLSDTDGVRALCTALAAAAPLGLPTVISIDQEGGRVARLGPPVTALPPMRSLGTAGDPDATHRAAETLGRELRALGITLDFAPVCDVDSNPANPVIGDRSFGATPDIVETHVQAFVHGLQSTGVMACAKHFPGHGDTETDSHVDLPRVRHPRARLDAVEIPPFVAAVRAGVATVMSAHVVYDALDPGVPATLSHTIMTDLLRGTLGFTGVAFSDDLQMRALSARMSADEAAVQAIAAGCDGLLVCTDPSAQEQVRQSLAETAGRDGTFAARLTEAHGRMVALRRRANQGPYGGSDPTR